MKQEYINWNNSLRPKQVLRKIKHFDRPINLQSSQDLDFVSLEIEKIQKHEFLPFVKYGKQTVRYRKDNGIPTKKLKYRPIMYASHLDSHIYSYYNYIWSKKYEGYVERNNISTNVTAYRKQGRNNIDFANEVFNQITKNKNCTVITVDISKFFDKLRHNLLIKSLCEILEVSYLTPDDYKVVRSLTAFKYISQADFKRIFVKTKKRIHNGQSLAQLVYVLGKNYIRKNKKPYGIPQGSPISGLLANMYLASFDALLQSKYPSVMYRRYSDDIILVTTENDETELLNFLKSTLSERGLDFNMSKVQISYFEERDGNVGCTKASDGLGNPLNRKYFDYLGFEFTGIKVFVRGGTLQKNYSKAKKRIQKYIYRQTNLNPKNKHRFQKARRTNYMKKAAIIMSLFGNGIKQQISKKNIFVRKTKREVNKTLINMKKTL